MAKTRWLDDRQQHLWRSYIRMNQDLYALLGSLHQSESGISVSDYGVLVALSEAPDGVVRARDLGVELGWDRSRISHQLSRMEHRGLVTRERCPDDARGSIVRLTPAGRSAIEAAAPNHVATVRRFFLDPLSDDELDTLATLFDRLLAGLADTED